jgi:hypothetical protein
VFHAPRAGVYRGDTPDIGVRVPKNKTQQLQAEGRRSRQAVLDYLADCLTSPNNPATAEQLTEFKMTSWHFPDIKQAIDKVERVFTDKEDLRRAIMLAAAYELIERLIA